MAQHIIRHNFQHCITLCGVAPRRLKLQPILSVIVLITIVQDKPSLKKIDSNTLKQNKQLITKLFLFDKKKLKVVQDKSILTSTIDFLQATNRDLRPRYLIKCLIGMVPSRHLHVQS